MNFNEFSALLDDFYKKPWKFRMKLFNMDHPTNWQSAIWSPTDNYIENHSCLAKFSDVEYIEIDPIENRYIGRLVPNRIYDHTTEVHNILKDHTVEFKIEQNVLRIKVQ